MSDARVEAQVFEMYTSMATQSELLSGLLKGLQQWELRQRQIEHDIRELRRSIDDLKRLVK